MSRSDDLLLAKLEWARLGQSERQILDVVGIMEVRDADLDLVYIESWLDELSVRELWERVVAQRRTI